MYSGLVRIWPWYPIQLWLCFWLTGHSLLSQYPIQPPVTRCSWFAIIPSSIGHTLHDLHVCLMFHLVNEYNHNHVHGVIFVLLIVPLSSCHPIWPPITTARCLTLTDIFFVSWLSNTAVPVVWFLWPCLVLVTPSNHKFSSTSWLPTNHESCSFWGPAKDI
jgi:hypothetical protein